MGQCQSPPKGPTDVTNAFYDKVPWTQFTESELKSPTGTLNFVRWLPNSGEPKAIVLICHGLYEHCLRYHKVAHRLTARGIAVYAIDHYAHGKSYGEKGLIDKHELLISDFAFVAGFVRALHSYDLPFFILAHSMGSLVTLASYPQIQNITGIVFSGCALISGPAASPFGCKCLFPLTKMKIGRDINGCMSSIDPRGSAAPIPLSCLLTSAEDQKLLKQDTLRFQGDINNKTAGEFLKLEDKAKENLSLVSVPFLCLHGEDDLLTMPAGSELLLNETSTESHLKRLQIFPGLRHEILFERDPEGSLVVQAAVAFIQGLVPALSSSSYQTDVDSENQDGFVDQSGLLSTVDGHAVYTLVATESRTDI